jgi:NADH:ubiquinone oxidoreductase subunit C
MTYENIQNDLAKQFSNLTFEEEGQQFLNIHVSLEDYYNLMLAVKEMGFDSLYSMIGMDWGKELGIINYFENTATRTMITVRVKFEDRETPEIETIENIWKNAHLNEREIFDLFGINFKEHSVMKRLLLPEDWEGYPMRKDWMDDTKMIIR